VNAACERGALGEGRSKGLPWPRAICESVEMSTRECDWVIGFDADDTLWHNEIIFERTQTCFRALLGVASASLRKVKNLGRPRAGRPGHRVPSRRHAGWPGGSWSGAEVVSGFG